MKMELQILLGLMLIVFTGFWIQTISGFGSMVFMLPLAILLIDKSLFLPVSLAMAVFQSTVIAYKDRQYIIKKDFLILLTQAGIGAPFGIFLKDYVSSQTMNYSLGVFILINSISGLYFLIKKSKSVSTLKCYHHSYPFFSGLLQAAYGVGGPILAAYLNKKTTHKRIFRSMFSLYWVILNPFILLAFLINGDLSFAHVELFIYLLPSLVLAIYIGNRTVDKISKTAFQTFIHIILILISFSLFF